MAITHQGLNLAGGAYTPTIWSKKMVKKFYAGSVCNQICNTDWQGEILGKGNAVEIRQRPDVAVNPTQENMKINWQDVIDVKQTLTIDYAFDAAVKLGNIDMHQMDINLQAELVDEIANRLRLAVETTILGSAYSSAATKLTTSNTGGAIVAWGTATNPGKVFAAAQAFLSIAAEPCPTEDRWILLHPVMKQYLIQETFNYALNAGLDKGAMQAGYVAYLAGFHVYESPLVTGAGTSASKYNAMAGHSTGITMAVQFTQFDVDVPLQDYYGKGIRAQNCFGFKVIKPTSLLWLETQIS